MGQRRCHVSMNASAESDGNLARAAATGDLAAFELLIQRFEDQLYRDALGILGSREDALDVVQDTFVAALGNIRQIRDPDKVGSWLRRAVHNRSLNVIRAEGRRKEAYARYFEELDNFSYSPGDTRRDAQKLLVKLPELSVNAFLLHYVDELPLKDVARRLSTSETGVKQRLYRVRRYLRREILSSVSKGDPPMSTIGTAKKKGKTGVS